MQAKITILQRAMLLRGHALRAHCSITAWQHRSVKCAELLGETQLKACDQRERRQLENQSDSLSHSSSEGHPAWTQCLCTSTV